MSAILILPYLVLIICTAYLVCMKIMFKKSHSISYTYKQLKDVKELYGAFFSLFCFFSGILLLFVWMDIIEGYFKITAFFACGGLMMVGAAPDSIIKKNETIFEQRFHYVFAMICVVSALIVVLFYFKAYEITIPLFLVAVIIALRQKNWIYWIEVAAIYSAVISTIMHIILNY